MEPCPKCGAFYRPGPFNAECTNCRAPLEKFKTPEAKKREEAEERLKAETFETRKAYFQKMMWIGRAKGLGSGMWRSAYKSRYGIWPPEEWG